MTGSEITSCEDALRLLAAYLDGELEDRGDAVERHLRKCRSCYSRAEFEKRLRASVAELRAEPVHEDLSARVHTLIDSFTTAASG
ncbi:MAG TPA: zf-HC2 domain-containing protein [Longimicrobiales bacterium]|nr:zf-HC2 domain-containing protein [Longimicrobiales bacterium]